jgi:MFS family permease
MAAMIGSSALVSWAAGRWIDRRGRKSGLLLPATVCLAGGFAILALADQVATAALALSVIGIGLGGINVPLIVIMGDLVPPDRYGRAIGIYQVLGDMGGSLGPITGLEAIHRYGPTPTLATLAVTLMVTIPLALLLWWRERGTGGPASGDGPTSDRRIAPH